MSGRNEQENGRSFARYRRSSERVAAAGHVAVVEDAAIFDRISTDAAHRRRGLGRAVMCALDAASRTLGARRGVLGATADGYAMYRALGWHLQSPLASGVIVAE